MDFAFHFMLTAGNGTVVDDFYTDDARQAERYAELQLQPGSQATATLTKTTDGSNVFKKHAPPRKN